MLPVLDLWRLNLAWQSWFETLPTRHIAIAAVSCTNTFSKGRIENYTSMKPTMKAPESPGSTIERDPSSEMAKTVDDGEEFDYDCSSMVDSEVDGNELQMFSDLSALVQNLETTLDTVTIHSADLSDVHLSDDTDSSDDDDLETEWAELSRVEGLVRKELELEKLRQGDGASSEDKREHTLYDHFRSLKLQEVEGIGYVCDKIDFLEVLDKPSSSLANDCIEFCQPVPDDKLAALYYGLESSNPPEGNEGSTLPFRSISFRIRPDKLSGAVMDSVCNAISASSSDNNLNLLKRQGGHLRAVISNDYGPYVVDAQLCITRMGTFQRQLLLRMYYATEKELAEVDISSQCNTPNTKTLRDAVISANNHLKEACSLVQLMSRLGIDGDRRSLEKPFSTFRKISYEVASSNLRTKFRKSYSVKNKTERKFFKTQAQLLPSLSKEDWLQLQSSWSLVENVWDGLAATFAHSSLYCSSLEKKNQIPCLDVHYCMDLFKLSEEKMFIELEKAKGNLRTHEEKGRYISKVFADVTKPMFEMYCIAQVEDLQEIHTDFAVPEFEEEDNGSHIFIALASKSLQSSGILNEDRSILQSDREVAEEAVYVVCSAFQNYHSGIQGKLVKYMSTQVQKTLYRYRFCIHETYKRLKNAYRHSKLAVEESNRFLDLMLQAKNLTSESTEFSISPFLKCTIEGGECYVTETHLLLFTNKLFQQPSIVEWFHQSSALVFQLSDIQVTSDNESYLKVTTKEGGELVQFCPSADVDQLLLFISIMQSLQHEDIGMVGLV